VHNYEPSPFQDIKIDSVFQRVDGKVAFTNFVNQKREEQKPRVD